MTVQQAERAQRDEPGMTMAAKDAVIAIHKGSAPAGLRVIGHLKLAEDLKLEGLPSGLTVDSLDVSNCIHLRFLPSDLKVRRLNISGCIGLEELPQGLSCYELKAEGTVFETLPDDLQVEYRLDLSNNTELRALPRGLKVGTLNLTGCTALESLPEGLDVYFLDLSGCTGLRTWPQQAALRFGRLNARGCTNLTTLPGWLQQ
ncbi:MAG TPA: hypothetical protein VKU00_32750, partial [Chthonomonadaceae bacterium]|nr:hypothetical protein [Chthonomonadaceae bacterium]